MTKPKVKYKKMEADHEHEGDPDYCLCGETVLYDASTKEPYRVKKPKWHSCAYILRTNLHLHEAAIEAANGPLEAWQFRFSEAMNKFRFRVMREMEAEEAAQHKLDLEIRAQQLMDRYERTIDKPAEEVALPVEQVGPAAEAGPAPSDDSGKLGEGGL
jgi:hypothetical protein